MLLGHLVPGKNLPLLHQVVKELAGLFPHAIGQVVLADDAIFLKLNNNHAHTIT